MSWFYHPYPLGEEAVPFVAAPVRVTLANRANRQGAHDTRRDAHSRYTQPVVKAPLAPLGGILIQYVRRPQAATFTRYKLGAPRVVVTPLAPPLAGYLTPTRDRNPPATRYRLYPPTVVTPPSVPFVASPIKVVLADQLIRITRKRAQHRLTPPVVVYVIPLNFGPGVRLAPQTRGTPKSILRPPAVVTPERTDIFFGPKVVQARRVPYRRPMSVLGMPVVVTQDAQYGPDVHLTYSRRGAPKSVLRAPVVVTEAQTAIFFGPRVTLTKIRPRRTLALLLTVPDAFRPVGQLVVHLAADSPRGKAKPKLKAPAVVAPVLARPILVHLAYSRRGVPKSKLKQPTVVGPVLARPIITKLVRIRPVRTTYILRRPADLVDSADLGYLHVHLAYSRRGVPKSILRKPTVVAPVLARAIFVKLARIRPPAVHSILRRPADLVDAADLGYIRVHLAYSLRGKPKSRLSPPTVVFPFIARPTEVALVRIRPAATHSILRKPTDLVDQADLGYLRVHLAPSFRGKAKPHLSPPAVVFTAVELSGPEVTLVRIRPPRTMWLLRAPVAGAAQLKAEYDLRVTLAYSLRGKPKSKLRPPVVVTAATPYFRREPVTLAPQRRGKAKPFLRPPVVVNRFVARPILVSLAPSRFPTPKSKLRPPAVVGRAPFAPISVHLTYSRRGKPKSRLTQIVYGAKVYAPIGVTLAPSRFPRPKSLLKPPTVVTPREVVSLLRANLTRIRPPRVHSTLRPPTVIDLTPQTYFLSLTLVRIRPPRTHWLLKPPTVQIEECYGDPMCGFDFAAEVCGSDEAATVIGSTATGTSASGSDSAATVEGATAASGSVTGDDARREGC